MVSGDLVIVRSANPDYWEFRLLKANRVTEKFVFAVGKDVVATGKPDYKRETRYDRRRCREYDADTLAFLQMQARQINALWDEFTRRRAEFLQAIQEAWR